MCGMLASDVMSLPDRAVIKLQEFFALSEAWIADAMTLAIKQGVLKKSLDVKKAAAVFLGLLEGAMLISRTQKNTDFLEVTTDYAIHEMKA